MAAASHPTPPPVAELMLVHEVERYVRQRSAFRDALVADALIRRLVQRIRVKLRTPTPQDVSRLLNQELPAAFLEAVQQQTEVLWLTTERMVNDYASRRLNELSKEGSRQADRAQTLSRDALLKLEGGNKVLTKYLESPKEASFLSYLYVACDHMVTDLLRGTQADARFWKRVDALADEYKEGEEPDVAHPSAEQGAEHHHPERITDRHMRRLERKRVIALIRDMAVRGASAGRERDKMVLEYLEWLELRLSQELPGERLQISQNAFALERGYPSGTLNANLKRFRDEFGRSDKGRKIDIGLLFSTSGGTR